jgi:hypothetical protein
VSVEPAALPRTALRTAQLFFWDNGSSLSFLFHSVTSGESIPGILGLDRSALANKLARLQHVLDRAAMAAAWAVGADPLEPPTARVRPTFDACLERLAAEGWSLYGDLASHGLAEVLARIQALPDGSSLSIVTDWAFLPWEILYPCRYHQDWPPEEKAHNPLLPQRLWGYRLKIECRLLTRECPVSLYEAHQNGPPFVSLNLHPHVEQELTDAPTPSPYQQLYESRLHPDLGELRRTAADIKALLLSETPATLIYLLCHGSCEQPFHPAQSEQLELDQGIFVEPGFLDNGKQFPRAPVVILNSCSSAVHSPLVFSSFLSKLQAKRAMGLVGTTLQIPTRFAAAFGQRLIEEYLRGVAIGDALWTMRRALLDGGNPLGMFYSLQCPMHVAAPSTES